MIKILDSSKFCKKDEIQGDIPPFKKISKEVMSITWASMLECFLIALVNLFDGIQVAGIDNVSSAAVTVTRSPYYVLVAIIMSLNITISAIIARRKGEKDIEKANKTMHLGLLLSTIISLFLSIIGFIFARQICLIMQAKEDTIEYATIYFKILCCGFVFNGLRTTINACQKSIDKTRISMVSNLVANIVNILFNYLLINGIWIFPRLEIKGAAIATVFGNFVAFMISLFSLFKEKDYIKFRFKTFFKLDKELFKPINQLLWSNLIEQMFMRIGFVLFAAIVNGIGTTGTFVHGICNDINMMIFTIADGFAVGTSAIVGHRLGEKRKDLAIVYGKACLILAALCGFIVSVFVFIFREPLILLYKPDSQEKIDLAKTIMIFACITCIPQNIQWQLTGVLRSSGDTRFTSSTSLGSVAIVRPLFSYLLVYVLFGGIGVIGAWIGQLIDQLLRMTLNIIRFNSRKWINIKV